ncbi:hypothetical protein Cme02nite_38370 [Catellatospora methionotrophica]|uniref:Uncharacterized protein n=1 Tax=Catellatospora methionotrophica TaxID=121620 RepID=A0A8J3LJ98_9ACTN|nr:hypothetical protein [Catellatospora methionotrophica]GIG15505.1 hypothetical protein Cme02nite_38370 [Catellatospora methionotrophica]
MSTDLPDPERVVSALIAAGWTYAGQRTGLYKRLYWPGVTDLRGRSIVIPLNSDFADYHDLMTAAPGELELAAEVGRIAAAALAAIADEPQPTCPLGGCWWCTDKAERKATPAQVRP